MWDGVNKNIQIAYMEGMCGFDGVDPQLCFKSVCDVYGRQTLQAYVFLWEN